MRPCIVTRRILRTYSGGVLQLKVDARGGLHPQQHECCNPRSEELPGPLGNIPEQAQHAQCSGAWAASRALCRAVTTQVESLASQNANFQ